MIKTISPESVLFDGRKKYEGLLSYSNIVFIKFFNQRNEIFPLLFISERTKAKMADKSVLLRQMRKHAQSFSSALTPPKVVDEANLKHALGLIDVTAKDSRFGTIRKLSFKTPPLLKALRLENNLNFLRTELNRRVPEGLSLDIPLTAKEQKKESDKVKRAETKLRKLLATKDC
tara:strand:+ start:963 stop:1484 length:522 start_codon:yes stop_codon:yes gene_type:complete